MQPETSNTRWTFARMVAELPAESRYELHEGVLLDMSPSPSSFHQDILLNLSFIFRTYLQKTLEGKAFIAPLDVVLADYEVVQPDLFVLVGEPRQRIDTPFRGVPDLVVEILSPANIRRDKVEKRALYAQFGVKEYWIIDPDMQAVEDALQKYINGNSNPVRDISTRDVSGPQYNRSSIRQTRNTIPNVTSNYGHN
jgi:Uma2 family endonuclease